MTARDIAMTRTLSNDNEDRDRIKASIHAVLDSLIDADSTLPESNYSCSCTQLKIRTQLAKAYDLMMYALYLTNQE